MFFIAFHSEESAFIGLTRCDTMFDIIVGVRLYMAVKPFNAKCGVVPSMLKLVHVRLPPGFTPNTNYQRPSKVHIAHYRKGKQFAKKCISLLRMQNAAIQKLLEHPFLN